MTACHVGLLTVSDRASKGAYEDLGGPAMEAWLTQAICTPWVTHKAVVSDDIDLIKTQLRQWAQQSRCSLILTTGGTGPAPRDVTPEATMAVCDKLLPGFGEQMRQSSLNYVPTAILSRQTAGIIHHCLVVNLPGKPQSISECLDAIFPAIPYCLDLIGGDFIDTHPEKVKTFRPSSA